MTRASTIPKSHLFTEDDLHLYELQNIFTACTLWLENGLADQVATYDLVVRDLPENRNFLLFGGLEEIIHGIRRWRYTADEVRYLQRSELINERFARYLRRFHFSGDLWAMPEGTAFFPGEPIVRIQAPIIEGNLLTMFLIQSAISNTIFLSKIARVVLAANAIPMQGTGGLRAHSFESGLKAMRAGYLLGIRMGTPTANRKFHLAHPPISINAYHAVIKSFPTELDAFRAAARLYPNRARLMVDTYDFEQGIANVIQVAREVKDEGNSIAAITIDSGNLAQRCRYARKAFDRAGFPDIKIVLASNLDEWKIAELVRRHVPADAFLAQTEVNAVADDPKLEVVYKIAEISGGKQIRPLAKFSPGKLSLPGRKQVYRTLQHGKLHHDVIGLTGEQLGQPLLRRMIHQGQVTYQLPSLDHIRDYIKSQLTMLPSRLKRLDTVKPHRVTISPKLRQLLNQVKREHIKK